MKKTIKRLADGASRIYRKGFIRNQIILIITVSGILFLFAAWLSLSQPEQPKLPEGNTGIASKYPGDKNIEKDPAVLFADDFEQTTTVEDLSKKWDLFIRKQHLTIDKGAGYGNGGNALLMTVPKQEEPLSTGVARSLTKPQDVLFLRWYMKYDAGWFVPGGSVHNGGVISSRYFPGEKATPGVRADGRNKFLVNYESENPVGDPPGHINAYVYWPEQGGIYGDHFFPSGKVIPGSDERAGKKLFGDQFVSRPDFSPQRDRWYCYEYMVRTNTPGKRDGRIAFWLDGKLIADFPNLRFRDVDDLKIDRFDLSVYIANNKNRTNRKWHDNVVAATSYIGPLTAPK